MISAPPRLFAWSLFVRIVGAMAVILAFAAPARAQLVDLHRGADATDSSRAQATLTLTWPVPASVQATVQASAQPGQGGDEWLLHFDQPLDFSAFAALATPLQPWVAAMSLGYDSMVLRLQPGVVASAEVNAGRVVLTLSKVVADAAPAPASAAEVNLQARARLKRLKASLLFSLGEFWQAATLLDQLRAEAPDDPELLRMQSSVEARLSRWRRASSFLDLAVSAGSGGPVGEAPRAGLPLAGSPDAPQARLELRRDGQQDIARRDGLAISGHVFLGSGVRVVGSYELARPELVGTGLWLGAGAVERHRGGLGLRWDDWGGSWIGAELAFSAEGVGGTVQAELWDRFGGTQLRAAAAVPRWETAALAALQAERDGITLQRSFRTWPTLGRALRGEVQAEISATIERWRAIEVTGGAERSDWVAQGTLRYISFAVRPRLWASYTVRVLGALGGAAAIGSAGGTTVERLRTRGRLDAIVTPSHVHVGTVGAQLAIWRWWSVDGHIGYGLNLDGPGALQLGAATVWRPPTGLFAELRYGRGLATSTIAATTDVWTLQAGVAF